MEDQPVNTMADESMAVQGARAPKVILVTITGATIPLQYFKFTSNKNLPLAQNAKKSRDGMRKWMTGSVYAK